MSSKFYNSLYYADDKDIQDLLDSSQRKMSKETLVSIARQRGLLLSKDEERAELVRYVTVLPFDWPSLKNLLELTNIDDRAERSQSMSIEIPFDPQILSQAIRDVRQLRSDHNSETYSDNPYGQNRYQVNVDYVENDFSRTRLAQKRKKTAKIEFEREGSVLRVRFPASKRAEEVSMELIKRVQEISSSTAAPRCIELGGIRSHKLRTEFFTSLMQKIDGFRLYDVTDVRVARLDDPPSEENGETNDKYSKQNKSMLAFVKESLLRGNMIIDTPEYKRLCAEGFYIARTIWTVEEGNENGVRAEFEAGLDETEQIGRLEYKVKAIQTRGRDGEFNKTKKTPDDLELHRLIRLLEKASEQAHEQIVTAASPASLTSLFDAPAPAASQLSQTE